MTNHNNLRAVLAVTIATALFTVVFASAKFAGETASAMQILWLRYIGGLACLLLVSRARGLSLREFASPRPGAHFLRASFGASGGCAIIWASANMPIVDATAIGLLQVVFLIAMGVVLLGERISMRQWGGIGGCCLGAGVVVTSRGAFQDMHAAYLLPAALALAGALLVALETYLIKLLSEAERPMAVLLHVNAFGVLLMAVPAVLTWQAGTLGNFVPFLLLGPVAVTAQYLVVIGYRDADTAVVGPIDYSWLIFAALLGWVFFDEIPGVWVLIGSAFIVTGGTVLAMQQPQRSSRQRKQADLVGSPADRPDRR